MTAQGGRQEVIRPLSRGVNSELAPSQMHPEMALVARDCSFIDGILCQRNGWEYVGDDDPVADGGGSAATCARVSFDGGSTTRFFVSNTNGFVADGTTSGAPEQIDMWSVHKSSVTYHPTEFAANELILCPQNGRDPIRRWAGTTEQDYDSTGTFACDGTTVIVGSGTNFASDDVGRFIGDDDQNEPGAFAAKVVSFESTTRIAVDHDTLDDGISGQDLKFDDLGVFGLYTLVTDVGTASVSGTALTGKGTDWDDTQDALDHGAVKPGDLFIWDDGTDVAASDFRNITTVTDDTNLVLRTSGTTKTDVKYKIVRPLVGTEARLHRGRLYVTGVQWAGNRIYYTRPIGTIPLGTVGNGRDSLDFSAEDAVLADYVDVEDRNGGKIIALTSVTEGLLVHREAQLGVLTGDPVNGHTYYPIGNIGTVDKRSVVEYEGVVYFASSDGFFAWTPGSKPTNLVEDSRMAEWHRRDVTECICGAIEDHVIVVPKSSSYAPQEEPAWVWDVQRKIWVGDWYYNRPGVDYMYRSRIPGQADELYSIGAGGGGLGALRNTVREQIARITGLFSSSGPDTYKGSFLLRLPPSMSTFAGSRQKKLQHVKPYYSWWGDDGASTFYTYVGTGEGRRLYDTVQTEETQVITVTTGATFPLTFPVDFSAASTSSTLNWTVTGTAKSPQTLVIEGPVTDPVLEIRDAANVVYMTISFDEGETVASGQELVITGGTGTGIALNNGDATTVYGITDGITFDPGAWSMQLTEGTGISAGVTTLFVRYYPGYGG